MTTLEHTIKVREEFYERMNLWVYKHPDRPRSINRYTLEIGPLTVDIMHHYAHTLRHYLLTEGIHTTYNSEWLPYMEVNAWSHSWWVEGYELGVLLLGPTIPADTCTIPDTRISLSSYQILGSWHGSLSYREQGIKGLLPLLRVTNNGVRAYMQCGTCHYSDIQVGYCGMGRELLSDCNQFTIRR